ncbi:hypothetical protein CI109_104408 [Kwoniella shandongensis]|uniref:Uncharacterized protein n=1 Tax=Kwoniella shandongensis TaxID=1734106 RepID=A0A5M6BYS6_9TREE|nr:uncharacterized protein CI109_004193 [Kwoniella shandongensis]KAA5527380.1 hypothetical protein CI109_004193 [Kwoniella shandongensis]
MSSDSRKTRRTVELIVFGITFALAVTCLGAIGNALAKRNHEVGEATRLAATRGVYLIVATNRLVEPGYALCAATCSTIVNSLTLILLSFFKLPHAVRKFLWIVPLFAVFNALFLIATCIPVFVAARTGHLTLWGRLGTVILPQSVLHQQAQALGLTDAFWGKGYVKFMAIISIPTTIFGIATAILAYGWWRREQREVQPRSPHRAYDDTLTHESSGDEKGRAQVNQV